MDPISALLLAQAIPTGINLVKSAVQGHKANQLAKTPRPTYEIPQGVLDAVNNAKYVASMRELPGQNLMENRIGQNVSRGIADLKDVSSNPSELASNVARMYLGSNNALNDIGIAAGRNWLGNQAALRDALGTLGEYQNRQWELNKYQPYANNMAASSALREGSFRNLSAAGQNIASGISGYANMKFQQDMLDQLLGNGGEDGSINIGGNYDFNKSGEAGLNEPKGVTMQEALSTPNINGMGLSPSGTSSKIDMNAILKYLRNNNISPKYQGLPQ